MVIQSREDQTLKLHSLMLHVFGVLTHHDIFLLFQMLQISFILKIFVYLAAFNTSYENNAETFVKLEIGNICCLKFECSVAVSHQRAGAFSLV